MKFQIGKDGVTEGVVLSLSLAFKTHKIIRISVLKNQSPSKEKVREIADELSSKLGELLDCSFQYTLVGFTIILRKDK